ncbi:MAG: TonB-dependent receptor [Bacteroidota bacterium]
MRRFSFFWHSFNHHLNGFILLCFFGPHFFSLHAQATLSGLVLDETNAPIPFANVLLMPDQAGTTTGEDGRFLFTDLEAKIYTLTVSFLGYEDVAYEVKLARGANIELEVILISSAEKLREVVVRGASEIRQISEQALAITAVDYLPFQNSSIDAASLLDRVNGVRVRQAGGLGSDLNISIQGAQGNTVRRYFDGLPIRFLAAGLDLNNLPVNQIERVEVYRGITPLELGTDALGGGINIVPKKLANTQLDASYQYGSFNTHRASANAFVKATDKLFFSSNLFYNYSDNDYPIKAQDFNEITRRAENNIEVRRFNDRFTSYYADFSMGIRDLSWADEIKITALYSLLDKQIQTGVVFNPVRPVGEAFTSRDGVNFNLDFRWSEPSEKFRIISKTNAGFYGEVVVDSTENFYNWFGEILETPNSRGTDLLAAPASISLDQRTFLQRLTLSYRIHPNHQLTASNLFIAQRQDGQNFLVPVSEIDPFQFPARLNQNYAGLEWEGQWFDQQVTSVVTYKNYFLSAEAISLENALDGSFEQRNSRNTYHGANVALKYQPSVKWLFRTSYEYAYRLPEENELFGNQSTIRSNVNLRPERSDNVNLGLIAKNLLGNRLPLTLEVNGFYRYQRDRIILLASGFDLAQFFNEEEVEISGVDAYVSGRLFDKLRLNASATFQDVRIRSALVAADAELIGTRLPNVPTLFYRFNATYPFISLFERGDRLEIGYYYDFVDEFSSVREADARQNVANFVPTQHVNSLELIYNFANDKLNLSFRINNLADDDLFDNFRVQRPGRNMNLKMRVAL